MLARSSRHLRQHFVAYLALFVALGGTSVAAVNALPKNSVGTKQVINGSLQRVDLSKKTIAGLRGRRGRPGPQGLTGFVGATGPAGPQGAAGANGAPGPPGPINLNYVESAAPIAAGASATLAATCPVGFGLAVTGGGAFTDSTDPAVNITDSDWDSSTPGGPPDQWFATVNNGSLATITFAVDAICTHPTNVFMAPTKQVARPSSTRR